MACLAITEGLRTTPIATIEVLLKLLPLVMLVRTEARMGDPVFEMRSDIMASVLNLKRKFKVIMDQSAVSKNFQFLSNGLIWDTDRSKTDETTIVGIHDVRPRKD